jgi:hypothetical protein
MPNDGDKKDRDPIVTIAALVILGLFFVILFWVFFHLKGIEQSQWEHSVYLLSGIEAIAFAAAGFLFGREVHRARADAAEERADKEESKKENAEKAAEKGKSLARLVKVKQQHTPARNEAFSGFVPEAKAAAAADYSELGQLADEVLKEE